MDKIREATDRRAPRRARRPRLCASALIGLCWLLVCAAFCAGQTRDLRLRVTVTHKGEQAWSGRFALANGQLTNLRRLDSVVDTTTPRIVNRETISFQRQTPAAVTFDVTATTDLTNAILLELATADQPNPTTVRVPLIDLVNGTFEQPIAETQFAVGIARVPGDALRVRLARQHLVFSPGETCVLDVVPHLAAIDTGAAAKLDVRLYAARSRRVLWRRQESLQPDENGDLPALERLEVPVPEREGVYDVSLTLTRDGLRNLLKTSSPAAERSVQLAVVSPVPPAAKADDSWRKVLEFDTSQPQWWERLAQFPAWEGLPGSLRQLFGENFGQPLFRQGRNLNRIEGDGWLALPLPVLNQGRVHRLEIEYPTETEQTMAVTLVERDPSSDAFTPVVQTGFHVTANQADLTEGIQSIMFWPRTRLSYVVLSNKSSTKPVEFGRLRVLQGPESISGRKETVIGMRRSLLHLTETNVTRVLAGSLAVDSVLQRPLTDWQTFLETGQHLVECLHHAGLSGAALPVAGLRCGLLPDTILAGGTELDSGCLFSSGQDALPKDVLELYFRLFDREKLQLVPTIRFDRLVADLESTSADGATATGIQLVSVDGRLAGTSAPRYNALDERVQQAIQQIVQAVVHRYAHHESFAGVAIELDGQSFACLPGWRWGYDQATVNRFLKQLPVESETDSSQVDISQLATGKLASAWQAWRVNRITGLYQRLASQLRRQRPDASLYLLSAGLMRSAEMRQALTTDPSPREALLVQFAAMGLDPLQLNQVPGLVMVRPYVNAHGPSLVQQQSEIAVSRSPGVAQVFPADATQIVNVATRVELPTIPSDRKDNPPLLAGTVISEIQPTSGSQRRQLASSLVEHDVRTVFLSHREPPSNVAKLADWLTVFRRLPANFQEHAAHAQGPLVVRQLVRGQETLVYAVNRSPWPVRSSVSLRLPSNTRLDAVQSNEVTDIRRETDAWLWRTELPPFGLAAAVTSTARVKLLAIDHQLPADVASRLQTTMAELANRASLIGEPRSFNILTNPSFDAPPTSGEIPGWSENQVRVIGATPFAIDASVARSGAALRLEGSGDVITIRSEPFAAPATGRLSMHVWLRRDADGPQPDLRLALEGQLNGQTYYRFASVGPAAQDQSEWAPFVLHIDDLPGEGLTDLRVRFDLLGQGKIWLDDVELYDLSFTRHEQQQTSKVIALADLQLREGRLTDCWHTLDRYWPRYVLSHVSPTVVELASVPEFVPAPEAPAEPPPEKPPSALQRMRRLIPQWPKR